MSLESQSSSELPPAQAPANRLCQLAGHCSLSQVVVLDPQTAAQLTDAAAGGRADTTPSPLKTVLQAEEPHICLA